MHAAHDINETARMIMLGMPAVNGVQQKNKAPDGAFDDVCCSGRAALPLGKDIHHALVPQHGHRYGQQR